jgi:hypothetical protein
VLVRRSLIIGVAIALPSALATGLALAAGAPHAKITVSPPSGGYATTFTVSFATPETTGRVGGRTLRDEVLVTAPSGAHGCLASASVAVPGARKGARVRVALNPRSLGGRWCAGTYRGRVESLQSPACSPGQVCPMFVTVRGVVGTFSLHVRGAAAHGVSGSATGSSPPPAATTPPPPPTPQPGPGATDRTPPQFAGIQSAFACTPGPQTPGETTPYTLSWQPASDDVTPSPAIVYDVYEANVSGGEDSATPTWTTPPGASSFRTPGLPSHGTAYFVVRARDQAGNEDSNRVEVRGVDPCV